MKSRHNSKEKKFYRENAETRRRAEYSEMESAPIDEKVRQRFYEKPYQLRVKEAQDKLKGG